VQPEAHTYGDVAVPTRGKSPVHALLSAHDFFPDMIQQGDPAPDFDLETDEGTRISLSDLRGRNVVLFFYPKDNTSG
jgi:hypothetical protein